MKKFLCIIFLFAHSSFFMELNAQNVISPYLDLQGPLYARENINTLNKAGNGWIPWAIRNTSLSETKIDLSNILSLQVSGSIGVGTTTPTGKLDINGNGGNLLNFTNKIIDADNQDMLSIRSVSKGSVLNLVSSRADAGPLGALMFTTTNGWLDSHANIAGIVGGRTGTEGYAGGYLSFWTKNNNGDVPRENMRINHEGNVAIGHNAPSQKLDVIGRLKFRSNNSATAGVWFTGYDGAESAFLGQTGNASSDALGIYHGGAWRFVLNQSGDVGLGVMAPTQKLDVVGRLKFRANASATAGVWFSDASGTESAFLGNVGFSSSDALGIYHGGTWRFVVNQNGNVGIGTINPDAKLAVKGVIHAEEVRVDLNVPAPDYVFEKDYDLISLTELETYITQHKHLPEVPSAKEMEANGLNLKEMNLLLLKKVEELTLHLIEQNKIISKQNDRILNLEINSKQ